MLTPSGSAWMTSTRGARRREDLGPDRAAGTVGAVEDDAEAAGRDRPRETQPMVAVAIEQLRARRSRDRARRS